MSSALTAMHCRIYGDKDRDREQFDTLCIQQRNSCSRLSPCAPQSWVLGQIYNSTRHGPCSGGLKSYQRVFGYFHNPSGGFDCFCSLLMWLNWQREGRGVEAAEAAVSRGQAAHEANMGEITEAVTEDRNQYVGPGQWESSRNCKTEGSRTLHSIAAKDVIASLCVSWRS